MFLEFLEVDEYPEHIKNLVQKERELEEQEKRQREIERNTCKVRFHDCDWQVLLKFALLTAVILMITQSRFCGQFCPCGH